MVSACCKIWDLEDIDKIKDEYEKTKSVEKASTFLMEPEESFPLTSTQIGLPEVVPDSLNIYDNYNFKFDYDKQLPVFEYRKKILNSAYYLTLGSTGSGKTTVIPQFIIDKHARDRKFCNILITQPRRVAAISTATRVSTERGWPMGSVVGYSVSLQKITSEDTRLYYVTTGILLQCLVSNPRYIDTFTHIIIDEVHERTEEIDLCLLVLKNLIKDSSNTKLILIGRQYDIQQYYLDSIPFIQSKHIEVDRPELNHNCVNICINIIENLSNYDCAFCSSHSENLTKSVLIFLPGLYEIHEVNRMLRTYVEAHKLHSICLT
ncbi:hypothetical protein MXB_2306 [Myxobolus squamalis]|nr:hypothetical protein MXB_2306 [Myxobolus squamalis]